ncbi:MAG: cellobiose phosphorylase, partial [Acholeplasmataceae bacterium]
MYTQNKYQLKKSFSSFLSGVAGIHGIPMWVYYVNRGQLISGFGLHHKNGAMMEFYPANQAYENVSKQGFRTFLKQGEFVFECFKVENSTNQTLEVYAHEVSITEVIPALKATLRVTYFTVPNSDLAGLVRKVSLEFDETPSTSVDIIDGLTHILPAKLDAGLLKGMSNTLRSWMRSYEKDKTMFYHLSASIGDTEQVTLMPDVNTYQTVGLPHLNYITDLTVIFGNDTSMSLPSGLNAFDLSQQSQVNHIPAAMSFGTVNENTTFYSLFSTQPVDTLYLEQAKQFDATWFEQKQAENKALHDDLMSAVETKTSNPTFDAYLKYCYMDNVLRGGKPYMLENKEGRIPYYVYSRKHGDLERDYNFFMLEPNYLSQGNGNFRDVLQNRRNDMFFEPAIKDFNIQQFATFIQADGYNPLNIQGILFHYEGSESFDQDIDHMFREGYSPGALYALLKSKNKLGLFDPIIKASSSEFIAHFHEGYWEDHFTYIYDLIETYQSVYPDDMMRMLFDTSVNYYLSPAKVMPRDQKYVKTASGLVRQYGSMMHVERTSHWLMANEHVATTSVYGKLLSLATNKVLHLDPNNKGLMYEGGKPGWNDAMNGLPGLFGSGVSEVFELYKLLDLVHSFSFETQSIRILKPFKVLLDEVLRVDFENFNERLTILEAYRDAIEESLEEVDVLLSEIRPAIEKMFKVIKEVVKQYESYDVIPTYITYEAEDVTLLGTKTHLGYDAVSVRSFKEVDVPYFLEGNARYLKSFASAERAEALNKEVMSSEIFDQKLKMYKTSAPLDDASFEIGRIKAFTPGWLESESIFLHMTYKYLLGLLVSGAYKDFYQAIQTNMICYLDDQVYGRSILENSSFLASSRNPDPRLHGQGFVARLSG